MRALGHRLGVAAAVAIFGMAGLGAQQSTPPAPSIAKLTGEWKINRDLSASPPDRAAAAGPRGATGEREGRGRGGTGGGMRDRGGNSTNADKTRALVGELTEIPERLTIIASGDAVTFTDDQGVVRRFATTGRKEEVEIAGQKVDATTKWIGGALSQQLTAGRLTVLEQYLLNGDATQLTQTIAIADSALGGGGPQRTFTRVFDRAN